MDVFELGDIAKILGMPIAKAKNWTIGRPMTIEASIRSATGHGSRNLFSVEDVWLMGVANELSKGGMAANAIGKVVGAVRTKFPHGLGAVDALFISRGERLTYRIETREDRLPADTVVRLAINVRALRATVDLGVRKLRQK
jgi:hypothetical protein